MKIDLRPKVIVAYHDNCIDGYTSAWVANTALEAQGLRTVLLPMSYNEESTQELLSKLKEWEDYIALYVVDFSLTIGTLVAINRLYPKLVTTILDHHKTAFERYAPTTEINSQAYFVGEAAGADIILKNNFCGASLCWNYFHPETTVPQLITYVEDYDLWLFRFGDTTKWVNKYLVQQEKSIKSWDRIATRMETAGGFSKTTQLGRELQILHDKKVEAVAVQAVPMELWGHKGLAVECFYELTSDVGHMLATESGTFGAMVILDLKDKKIKWSLRSNGDFDVSEIAKYYGGGGHKNAAGFETKLL